MAYSPATKLSYMAIGFQNAVVLSENKVMCTSGTYAGQTMLLVDWLILAGGDETVIPSTITASPEQVWLHAKQKAGIDPPSLAHVDLPQLLVPPAAASPSTSSNVPELAAASPSTSSNVPELAAASPSSSSNVPELAAASPSSSSNVPELAAASPSTSSNVPELAAASPSTSSNVPELRFPPPLPQRHVGDKLKWELNDETYRIAVFTKKGLLEVKNVKDGGAAVHNDCKCDACWEFNHNAPWRPRLPLAKAFFETESAWRASLPQGGNILTNYVSTR